MDRIGRWTKPKSAKYGMGAHRMARIV